MAALTDHHLSIRDSPAQPRESMSMRPLTPGAVGDSPVITCKVPIQTIITLDALAANEGKGRSDMIRQALDALFASAGAKT